MQLNLLSSRYFLQPELFTLPKCPSATYALVTGHILFPLNGAAIATGTATQGNIVTVLKDVKNAKLTTRIQIARISSVA